MIPLYRLIAALCCICFIISQFAHVASPCTSAAMLLFRGSQKESSPQRSGSGGGVDSGGGGSDEQWSGPVRAGKNGVDQPQPQVPSSSRVIDQAVVMSKSKIIKEAPEGQCGITQLSSGDWNSAEETFDELNRTGHALEREFPWHAFILVTRGSKVVTCSGAIIDLRWVLTTASCLTSAYHDPNDIIVYFGAYSQPLVAEGTPPSTFSIAVESVHYHPRFDSAHFNYDYALLKLVVSLDFGHYDIQPICIASSRHVCNMACHSHADDGLGAKRVVAGWLLNPDVFNRRSAMLISAKRTQNHRISLTSQTEFPAFNVMSQRLLQKFAEPELKQRSACTTNGFPSASLTTKTRICVEINNEAEPAILDSCDLHAGSVLMSAFQADNFTGVQFALCGLKSAESKIRISGRRYPANNCAYSAPFKRRSVSVFADICPVVDWINARYGLPTTTTTTTEATELQLNGTERNGYDDYESFSKNPDYYSF